YEKYTGIRTGLSAGDIAALQSLYGGPRQLDQYAGASTQNNSMATAAPLSVGDTMGGDISNNNEVEWFKFTTPLLNLLTPLSLEFRTGGVSLLTANVSVYDSSGHLVASTQSTDPLNGNLVLNLNSLSPLKTYYVQVRSSRSDVFGIGSYQMRVAND